MVMHITDFISNSTKEWKQFNHSPGAEYSLFPMVCTCDLEQSFDIQVPFFGNLMISWICDMYFLLMNSVFHMYSGVSKFLIF